MSGEYCSSVNIPVEVQENGIIRTLDGYILGRTKEIPYEEIEAKSHRHVTYAVDEMEHILNCFDNLFYIHEQPEETQKEWLEIIHKACSDARKKWCEVVKQNKEGD